MRDRDLIIKISIRELHNVMMKYPSNGVCSGARYISVDVIMIDTTISKYIPTQVKNEQLTQSRVQILT